MATGKNTIIVYKDWKNIFNELTDEEAGVLIKHFFSYVNDEDPELDDKYLRMAFMPIKDALKRDLKHWDEVREQRSISGKAGGLKSGETRSKKNEANEANALLTKQNEANEAVLVIDSVNVIDKEEEYIPKFNFKTSLIKLGISNDIVSDWLKVRSKKSASNTETAFNAIKREILKSGLSPNECIKFAVERSWSGFKDEWVKNETQQQSIKPQKQNEQPEPTYYKPIKFD